MNQLFNTVNYFEFQLSKPCEDGDLQALMRKPDHAPFLAPSYFPIVSGNKKAAEAFLRAAAFG